eukprot:TRINITY_DN8737_c0_g2_i1.p1 TRINITY_DN8737_c0_g2~~TRINITY_DN8737_c0_g2_i1.p1  ORF type:complete len:375 (+),score=50.96 TRINITY_DN8737_c0_g2_i1:37-1125(+)
MPSLSDTVTYEWDQTAEQVVITLDTCLPKGRRAEDLKVTLEKCDEQGQSRVVIDKTEIKLNGTVVTAEMVVGDNGAGPVIIVTMKKAEKREWKYLVRKTVSEEEEGVLVTIKELDKLAAEEFKEPPLLQSSGANLLKMRQEFGNGELATVDKLMKFHEAVMTRIVKDLGSFPPKREYFYPLPEEVGMPPDELTSNAISSTSMGEYKRKLGVAVVFMNYPPAVHALCADSRISLPEKYLWLSYGALVLKDASSLLALADMYQLGEELPRYKSIGLHLTQLAALEGSAPAMFRLGPTWDVPRFCRGDSTRSLQPVPDKPIFRPEDMEGDDRFCSQADFTPLLLLGGLGSLIAGVLLSVTGRKKK